MPVMFPDSFDFLNMCSSLHTMPHKHRHSTARDKQSKLFLPLKKALGVYIYPPLEMAFCEFIDALFGQDIAKG